jgi:hypothetical protein
MIKAPDPGVVKSLAKALRKNLPETVTLSHSKALEIAANSFGFSSWHACRAHFDRLSAGLFDPPEPEMISNMMEDNPISARALLILREEHRTFRYKEVTVQGGVSSGRSLLGFLLPLIEIGARFHPDPGVELSAVTDPDHRQFLSRGKNWSGPMNLWNRSHEGEAMKGCVLAGSRTLHRIIRVRNGLIPDLLKCGLGSVEADSSLRAVDLYRLRSGLRDEGGYPNRDITLAVEFEPLLNLMRLCQAQVDMEQDHKTKPAE